MPDTNQPNQNQGPSQQPSSPGMNSGAPAAVSHPTPAPTPVPQPQQQPPRPPQPPQQPQKTVTQQPQQSKPAGAAKGGNKNLFISGLIIVVVLVALIIASKGANTTRREEVSDALSEEVTDENRDELSGAPDADSNEEAPLSRAAALAAYSTKMIKVSGECSVTPATQIQPMGTTILLDNDTDAVHTVTVGPKVYTISPRHYTLSWLNLAPGTLIVMCDGKDTEARITVQ